MINGQTKLLCLLGSPVEHSFSPAMHNASFQKLNINASYMAFDVHKNSLKSAIEGLKAFNFVGANVTIPYKIDIMPYLDVIDPKAQKIGACNTVVNRDGTLYGYNTDVDGFIESFKRFQFDFKNKKIAVLGTGGASKAVVVGLLFKEVASIDVYSRTLEKANLFVDQVGSESVHAKSYDEIADSKTYDVVVNTTPIGMHPNEGKSVVQVGAIGHEETIFYDLVYNPLETEFLRQARVSNRRTLNGLDMLVYQGIYALRYWFDHDHDAWTKEDVLEVLKANKII